MMRLTLRLMITPATDSTVRENTPNPTMPDMIIQLLIEHRHYIIGAASPILGVYLSTMDQVEAMLRVLGLCVGLLAGVLTVIKLHYEIKKAKKK